MNRWLRGLAISAVAIAVPAAAADIQNARARQDGNRAVIRYDLVADGPVTISVKGSDDGGNSWDMRLDHLSGDVGPRIEPGSGKSVVWDTLRDYPSGVRIEKLVFELSAAQGSSVKLDTGMEFVWVEGGCFRMGSLTGDSDEKPLHEVCLEGFHLGKYEVTQAQWEAVMHTNPSKFQGDDLPVEGVEWDDVQAFIQRLNETTGMTYRLPTEAEWEYAAKGGSRGGETDFSGSNTAEEVAWYKENSDSKTHPVGRKLANELGLYDMSGNVWEWVEDWYGKDYYSVTPRDNPAGPEQGPAHVYRGGSWVDYSGYIRVSNRHHTAPSFFNRSMSGLLRSNGSIGFRLVMEP